MEAFLSKAQLRARGWTPALIGQVLGAPDRVEQKQQGLRKWSVHLYSAERVRIGTEGAKFQELIATRRKRAERAELRAAQIPRKYATWRAALPAAADYVFSLNRYAKHRKCSAPQKVEIYRLKNEFVRVLHEHGYCTASWLHRMEQKCRECAGETWCDHCGGTGVWRSIELWCFRFLIHGRNYCWHQPRELVTFRPVESLPPQGWEGIVGEKPVCLPLRRFADAKALLQWVIDRATFPEESPVPAAAAIEWKPASCAHAGPDEQGVLFPR